MLTVHSNSSILVSVASVKEGTETAFTALFNEFHSKIFRFFQKRIGQHDLACELTQLTFIKIWQSRHTLSTDYGMDVQCFTIASSVLIDYIRRCSAEKRAVPTEQLEMADTAMVHADGSFETTDYIEAATSSLPPVRKNIFLLKVVHGYSNKDVAEKLSISVKTVEDHYSKAIKQLRSIATVSQLFLFING
jgi:RNA polymerase sigma factor (sigma-70 family)